MQNTLGPTPCLAAICAGWGYTVHHIVRATDRSFAPLFASHPWREALVAVDVAALAQDLPATQAAFRILWSLTQDYVATVARSERSTHD